MSNDTDKENGGPDAPKSSLPDEINILIDALQIGMRGYLAGMVITAIPRLIRRENVTWLPGKPQDHIPSKFLFVMMAGFRLLNSIVQRRRMIEKWPPKILLWANVVTEWKFRPDELENMLKTFWAAFIASYTAIQWIPPERRVDLVFFVAVRAADTLFSILKIADKLRDAGVPKFFLDNGDVMLFGASCAVIMFCWFYGPDHALPASYNHWILKMSELDPRILEALRAIRCGALQYGQAFGPRHLFSGYAESVGYPAEAADALLIKQVPCEIVHGGIPTCTGHTAWVWYRGFLKSLALYIPVHILPALVLHPKTFTSRIPNLTFDVLRSASFLSSFIALQWAPICLLRTILPEGMADAHAWGPMLGGCAAGASVFLEKKSRRKELGLFVAPRAVYAFLYMIFVVGIKSVWTGDHYLRPSPKSLPKKWSVLLGDMLFGSSIGVLVTSYVYKRDTMQRGWITSVLKWMYEK